MRKLNIVLLLVSFIFLVSCGTKDGNSESGAVKSPETEKAAVDPKTDKGVGPITSLELDSKIDEAMAVKGHEIFQAKCTACHKPDQKYIGPAPKGILERRSPEFVMNIILNPEKMIAENDLTKQMVAENNGAVMANQNLSEEEARAVLEYFRTL